MPNSSMENKSKDEKVRTQKVFIMVCWHTVTIFLLFLLSLSLSIGAQGLYTFMPLTILIFLIMTSVFKDVQSLSNHNASFWHPKLLLEKKIQTKLKVSFLEEMCKIWKWKRKWEKEKSNLFSSFQERKKCQL